MHPGLQHHAPLQGKDIVAQPPPKILWRIPQLQQSTLVGKKTQLATHVEAENRHSVSSQIASGAKHGAVSSQHQGQVGQFRLAC